MEYLDCGGEYAWGLGYPFCNGGLSASDMCATASVKRARTCKGTRIGSGSGWPVSNILCDDRMGALGEVGKEGRVRAEKDRVGWGQAGYVQVVERMCRGEMTGTVETSSSPK